MRAMITKSIHCCISSPPYWRQKSYLEPGHEFKGKELGHEKTLKEYTENLAGIFHEVLRVLRSDGTLWVIIGRGSLAREEGGNGPGPALRIIRELGKQGWILQKNTRWNPKGLFSERLLLFSKSDNFYFQDDHNEDYELHENISTWESPEEYLFTPNQPQFIAQCVLSGCPEGGIVIDPMMGTGTIGMVANRLGRDYIGIDIDPRSVALAGKLLKGEGK